MPVPKRKRSRQRRDTRFANKGIKPQVVTACNNCEEPILPHVLCQGCGFFRGRKVIVTKNDRLAKRTEVRKAAESKASAPVNADAAQ